MVGGVWKVSFDRELHGEGAILWTGSERNRMVSFITSQLLISADEYFCYSRLRAERQIRGVGVRKRLAELCGIFFNQHFPCVSSSPE